MTDDIAVIAHRGASEDAPEHSLAAYRMAIADGADALECDVRMTADGHLVCVHDRRVNRTSNGRGAVSTLELADLAELDFGSWKAAPGDREDPDHTGEPPRSRDAATHDGVEERGGAAPPDVPAATPPGGGTGAADGAFSSTASPGATEWTERSAVLTLERLLQLVAATARPVDLAIETKHPTRWAGRVEQRLLETLEATPVPGEIRVMSFSARSLQRIQRSAPHLRTVYLMQFLLPRNRGGRLPEGVPIAGPGIRVLRRDPGYVKRAHAAGHPVHVWTVDEPGDVELCARLGVDAVITNRPRAVREQLRSLA